MELNVLNKKERNETVNLFGLNNWNEDKVRFTIAGWHLSRDCDKSIWLRANSSSSSALRRSFWMNMAAIDSVLLKARKAFNNGIFVSSAKSKAKQSLCLIFAQRVGGNVHSVLSDANFRYSSINVCLMAVIYRFQPPTTDRWLITW